MWYLGIQYLCAITQQSHYPAQIQAWLRREFYSMEHVKHNSQET